jgi:HPt (histidine-containing phosphotransfer) domain-containing protein
MDVRMPGIDGLEATRQIRAIPGPRGMVPVMAVTAQSFAEQIEICHRAGMASHISKPFSREALLAAVELAAPEAVETAFATVPLAALPAVAPGPSVFDRATFEETTGCLSPADVAGHLRLVTTHCEALLGELRAPDMLAHAGDLAALAHSLAGEAGLLGFLSLTHAGRLFERAAEAEEPTPATQMAALAGELAAAAETAVPVLRRELAGMTAVTMN